MHAYNAVVCIVIVVRQRLLDVILSRSAWSVGDVERRKGRNATAYTWKGGVPCLGAGTIWSFFHLHAHHTVTTKTPKRDTQNTTRAVALCVHRLV